MNHYMSQPQPGTLADEIQNFQAVEADAARLLADMHRHEGKVSMAVLLSTPGDALEAIHAYHAANEEMLKGFLAALKFKHETRVDALMMISIFDAVQEESGGEQIVTESQTTELIDQPPEVSLEPPEWL